MFIEFVIQNQFFSYSLEEFAQILDIPYEGSCVFTDKWSLDELAYGVPTDGPYQTNPPSPDDIILYIRIDQEGQVCRIRHEEEINVHEHQILTREIVPTLKRLEEIILRKYLLSGGNRDHVPSCLSYMLYCVANSKKFNLAIIWQNEWSGSLNKLEDPDLSIHQVEVIEFGDSYVVPVNTTDTTSSDKSGRTLTLTVEDMHGKKNDVKARTTLLLSLPDEHQLRFSKYKTAKELWAAILKTFGGNEATKKTKNNLLKQQYGKFKAEGSETLEHTFNRLQVIVGQLQFMDVEIEKDDLNQKFLTSLSPEWLMHTIVWRNRSDLDTMSLDDLYNHLKVYELEVQKKPEPNSQNIAFISSAKHSSGKEDGNTVSVPTASTNIPTASASFANISQDTACAYIASQSIGSQIKFEDINQIDEDDMEEIDIKWNMALLRFDKSKVECFNCHKMGHFARECRAPRSQDKERRDNLRHGSKAEEQAPKALMTIDGVGWDWSYMANDEKDHALVSDEVAPTEFALMANTSAESKVFDNSLCSKDCKKNNDSLNSKITDLTDKLFDANNFIYHYKLALAQSTNESIKKKLETLQQEKEGVDGKLAGLLTVSKDLDNLIKSQRPSSTIESTSENDQNRNPSVAETVASPITSKHLRNHQLTRTMLGDAKLLVTFWAEAVNTACYVQNMSQNKTPYELFNGRIPVIGFLKPFGCHVMILNTLDNLGKFEAKGDEGYFIGYLMYKRAANQEVKKDVSSLRYIILPNWAHDALLESSSSKPHDESSTQVPKGSGNPNPTASLSNPPADQMETLTVESPIPTVSSPVPTACLNDSPELSSEERLISKGVAN
nr:hypothetical protein [Tanacetum cinerariifolium]